ncbi:MAG TPA: serine/threonine-protein kinase, partial [Polyangiaceae bacterium]|nr:serine/threonine-protein kinase [Polyangiaceae bacterium]
MPSTLSSTDPLLGQLVAGRYRVMRCLGEGGMGKVYMAEHEAIEKRIALKVLHREYSANTDVVERFKQEAISASRIKHPNVIDVFDFGQLEDGACYIAMELLEGQDLGDALQQVGAFDPEQGLRIVLQVSRALGAAHMRGVVHRDLKPENVFLQNTPEGEQVVKIVDFGIAQLRKNEDADAPVEERKRRLTRTGMIFGTPEYMAPEQARGLGVDQRSDVYATGCILYELLSGSVPFIGESFLDVLNKHVMAPVPSLRAQPHAGPV